MTAKDREILKKAPLFSALGDECESWVKERKAFVTSIQKGEAVMAAENFDRSLVLITKGRAAVSKVALDGKRTVINVLSEGDVFGMATLFYERERFPSEITAESGLRMIVFPKQLVEEAFAASPKFAKEYVTLLSEKIHFLNEKLEIFTGGEAEEKLARYIFSAAGGRKEFELPCSVSRLAESLGLGRVSVYRAFDALAEKGVLAKDGKKIVIIDPENIFN